METKFIAYFRISKKGGSGLGLEAQRETVMSHVKGQLIQEFTEEESGTHSDRPELHKALAYAKLTGATLVVAKLDRLSRNAAFLNSIMDSPVKVVFADMPFADRFTIGIMAQVAQWEAERISQRTKEALAATKRRGTKLGGDRGNIALVSAAGRERSAMVRRAKSADRNAAVMPHVVAARTAGHTSLAEIACYLNDRHITTSQGGRWFPASVQRLLAA